MAANSVAEQVLISQHSNASEIPPYSWYDPRNDHMDGLVPYLQERLFRELSLQIERVPYNLKNSQERHNMYSNLALGDIDVLGSTTRTARVLKIAIIVDEPLFEVNIKVFVRRNNPIDYTGWSSLKGKKGVVVSYKQERYFYFFPELADYAERNFELSNLGSRQEAIQLLLSGEVDYWVDSHFVARHLIMDGGHQDQIKSLDTPLATLPLYMAVSKQSTYHDIAPKLAASLRNLRESGEYQQMQQRYMQRYLEFYKSEHTTAHN